MCIGERERLFLEATEVRNEVGNAEVDFVSRIIVI